MQTGRGAPAPAALPAGAKDVLSVEAAELRQVEAALRAAFGAFGYREVMTPVLEFAEVIDRAQEGGLRDAFRLFDAEGRVLVLRPDITIPIARLVATRMADHPGPVRVSYVARVFRPPAPGRPRASEQRQAGHRAGGRGRSRRRRRGDRPAGAEPARHRPRGPARGRGRRVADARRAGRTRHRAGRARGAERGPRGPQLRRVAPPGPRGRAPTGPPASCCAELPSLRGGRELLARIAGEVPDARAGLRPPRARARPAGRPRRGRRRDPRPGRAARLALLLGRGRRGLRAGCRRADRGRGALRRSGRALRPGAPRGRLRDHARPAAPGPGGRRRGPGPAARRGSCWWARSTTTPASPRTCARRGCR